MILGLRVPWAWFSSCTMLASPEHNLSQGAVQLKPLNLEPGNPGILLDPRKIHEKKANNSLHKRKRHTNKSAINNPGPKP